MKPQRIPGIKLLSDHSVEIKQLCLDHHVISLYAFGSVLNDSFNAGSDIDFLVDIDKASTSHFKQDNFNLLFALEELLNKPVDLVFDKMISNSLFRKEVDQTKRPIYVQGLRYS